MAIPRTYHVVTLGCPKNDVDSAHLERMLTGGDLLSVPMYDEADAIIGAWFLRNQALAQRFRAEPDIVQRIVHGITAERLQQMQGEAEAMTDPLAGYR